MEENIMQFVGFYNLYRRHGSLRKELNVKTPYDALEKWYLLEPELFILKPMNFKENLILLSNQSSQFLG